MTRRPVLLALARITSTGAAASGFARIEVGPIFPGGSRRVAGSSARPGPEDGAR